MDEIEIQSALTQIFGAALRGEKADAAVSEFLTQETIPAVYKMAKKHSLGHVVSRYLFAAGVELEPEMAMKLQRDELMTVYQFERMQYSFREICTAFDEAQIPYIPLKGSVLRPYYPDEYIRTSCDIDILVHEADLDMAVRILEDKGYRCGERHYHGVHALCDHVLHPPRTGRRLHHDVRRPD